MGKFKFNGHSSDDFGLVIQTPPTYSYPERDLTNNHIPGRSGDIVIDNKCYKNIERAYQIAKGFTRGTSYYANFQSILDWLNSANGSYARLEDSYDSDIYRLASFQIGGSFVNYLDEAGATEVRFNCKPQRYLKVGEENINYLGSELTIENPSSYLALPEITIKNLDTGAFGLLMMSVLDKDGNATSSVSFTNYTLAKDITINSEDQTIYDEDGTDKYEIVSLNGKEFPQFSDGITTIEFAKYEIETSDIINSYNSLLIASQLRCLSEYKTYAAIESGRQEKFLIKSYDYIIDSHKQPYSASSVQTMISKNSETYKFASYNSLLSNTAKVFQFTGTLADNVSNKPDWLNFTAESTTINAAQPGFFLVGISAKRIIFAGEDAVIMSDINPNAINTIYYYEATATIDPMVPENAVTPPSITVGAEKTYYTIKATYDDCPEWLSYTITYDNTVGANYGSPTKIDYIRADDGYYWTDKTWIFGTAQWRYYTGTPHQIFNSLAWNTSKRAFVATEGLSLSTTMTFTYKYCDCTPTTLPEHTPVTQETVNADTGEKKTEEINKVRFTVQDSSSSTPNLTSVSIYAKEIGYYSIKLEKDELPGAWIRKATSDDLATPLLTGVRGTDGFEVFYLDAIPNYADQTDWPSWLDPEPIKYDSNMEVVTDSLAPAYLKFKVKDLYTEVVLTAASYVVDTYYYKVDGVYTLSTGAYDSEKVYYAFESSTAYYRISSTSEDGVGGAEAWGSAKLVAGNTIERLVTDPVTLPKTSKDYYYIYKIDEKPELYSRNRCYTHTIDNLVHTGEDLPTWLTAEFSVENIEVNADTPKTIVYKANAVGYFKWDSNTVWKLCAIGDVLFTSGGKDDSNIYYLASLPACDQPTGLTPTFTITPIATASGNPTEVEYKVVTTGYYRFNNSINWEYLTAGTVLINSKINETNRIYYLKDLEADLRDLETGIKPRWWML